MVGGHLNDLVTDAHGHTFVGNFGFDLMGGGAPGPGHAGPGRPRRHGDGGGRGPVLPERHGDHARRLHADRGRDHGQPLHGVRPGGRRLALGPPDLGRVRRRSRRRDLRARAWARSRWRPTAAPSTPRATSGPPTPSTTGASGWRRAARSSTRSRCPAGSGVYACQLGGDDGRTLLLCAAPDFFEHNRAAAERGRPVHHHRRRAPRRSP